MSLLTEVADLAEVPVEGVVRVLTQKPVSRRIEQRVVAVVDDLDDGQLRELTRFALAAAPTVLAPRESVAVPPGPAPPAARALPEAEAESATASAGDELTVRLGLLFEELVGSLKELERDHRAERQDRLDDLSVLIDLISTGWSGVDRRLGRLERTLERLELERRAPPAAVIRAAANPAGRAPAPAPETAREDVRVEARARP